MPRKASEPRDREPIQKVIKKNGDVVYRTTLDYSAPGQPRQQRRATFATLQEARVHVTEVKSSRYRGEQVSAKAKTFDILADEVLAQAMSVGLRKGGKPVRDITLEQYRFGMAPARDAFGSWPVSKISEPDVEALRDGMVAKDRSYRSVKLTLWLVDTVLARAMRQGQVTRNQASSVSPAGRAAREATILSSVEFAAVTQTAKADRLAAGWLLTLRGLRRSEVLGLTWADVDLEMAVLHVRHGRTGPGSTLTPPKSINSERSLPMDADLLAALRAWRTVLAGTYGTSAVAKTAFVVVDEAGRPTRPDTYSVLWRRLCHKAGIRRRVRTHEARHSFITLLRDSGELSDRDLATWAGHDEEVMRTVYDKRKQVNRGQQRVSEAIQRLGAGA